MSGSLVLIDNAEPLVCVSKEIVGEGSYGEVIKCGSNKVIKKGDSFDREFNFLEKTKTKTTEKSPWVRMYRIATLETKRFAMDAVTTTLNKAQIGPNNINKYTCRLIRSLKKFHAETDYTHNDIKPDNIGVMSNGSIKLIDLGSVLERTAHFDHTPQTLLYTAIMEEDMDKHEARVKNDFWALGCSLYEMVVVFNDETQRCKMDKHLFFRGDIPNFRIEMSIGIMLHIKPLHLQYILGLIDKDKLEQSESDRISRDYLAMKRKLFLLNKNENTINIGKKIYSLMRPCFEVEKFDKKVKICEPIANMIRTNDTTIENQGIESVDSGNLKTERLIMTEQPIDKTEIKHLREFLKSIPKNYKWGAKINGTNVGGGRASVKRSRELNEVKVNRATIKEMKRLINEKENKSKLTK